MKLKLANEHDMVTISVEVDGEWVKTPYKYRIGQKMEYVLTDNDVMRFLADNPDKVAKKPAGKPAEKPKATAEPGKDK